MNVSYASTPQTTSYTNSYSNFTTPKTKTHQPVPQTPPLFSNQQRNEIRRTRASLESEIEYLNKRKIMLLEQSNNVKANIVGLGELSQLKSSVRSHLSSINSKHLTELMDEYIGIVQENNELQARCDILSKLITKEYDNRQNEKELANEIYDTLDFSNLSVNMPELPKDQIQGREPYLTNEINQYQRKLNTLKQELMSENCKVVSSDMLCNAASCYSRNAEAQWENRSIGTNLLNTQIQTLQKHIIDASLFLNQIEESLMEEKKKFSLAQIKASEEEVKAKSKKDSIICGFNTQLSELDQVIQQTKKAIEVSAKSYETILQEIKQISHNMNSFHFQTFDNDTDNDVNKSENYIVNSDKEQIPSDLYAKLLQKRDQLQKENRELSEKYSKQKNFAKKKEVFLKQAIQKLLSKLQTNQTLLMNYTNALSQTSFPIEKEMTSIIDHIDNTINELRSTYA